MAGGDAPYAPYQFFDVEFVDADNGWASSSGFSARDSLRGIFCRRPAPNNPGDITGDGQVNIDDLLAVIAAWGPCPGPPAACNADVAPTPGGDGQVNIDDLLLVISNWG